MEDYEMNNAPQEPQHTEPVIPTPPVMPWDPYEAGPEPAKKKRSGKTGRRILAAFAAVLVLLGSCSITAAVVNHKWQKNADVMQQQMEDLRSEFQAKIDELTGKVAVSNAVGTGVSVAGTVVPSEGMSPAQVYAMNVRSVVAISNQGTTTNIYGQVTNTASSGSGFILTADGYVVTNYHVINNAEKLTVITYDGTQYEATLIGGNESNDVALVKIDAENLPYVTLGSSNDLIVGDMVVAIGNPLGELTSTQTVGYVSAVNRVISVEGARIDMIQTDAAINSGNSGGPLFNMKGEVVGITSAKYSGNTGSGAAIEGIGFAIPIDDVAGMIEDLQNYGYVTGAYLGVMVRNLDASTAASYGLPTGVYVESVTEGSCAEKAGLKAKDIIIGLGDYELTSYEDLARALRKFKAGDTTIIKVYREGTTISSSITLDERPHEETQTAEPAGEGKMPQNGSYDEWFEYFFGKGNDNG